MADHTSMSSLNDWSVGNTGLYRHDELGDIEVKVERIYRDGPAAPALGIEFDGYWHAVVDPSKVRRLPTGSASGDQPANPIGERCADCNAISESWCSCPEGYNPSTRQPEEPSRG